MGTWSLWGLSNRDSKEPPLALVKKKGSPLVSPHSTWDVGNPHGPTEMLTTDALAVVPLTQPLRSNKGP